MSFIDENKERTDRGHRWSRVELGWLTPMPAKLLTTVSPPGRPWVRWSSTRCTPWIAGATGLFAYTQSARTWSMMFWVVARDVKTA